MSRLNELSFADLKAVADYVEKLKSERIEDLKSQGIDRKSDRALQEFDKLEFDVHTNLFSRITKLRKE